MDIPSCHSQPSFWRCWSCSGLQPRSSLPAWVWGPVSLSLRNPPPHGARCTCSHIQWMKWHLFDIHIFLWWQCLSLIRSWGWNNKGMWGLHINLQTVCEASNTKFKSCLVWDFDNWAQSLQHTTRQGWTLVPRPSSQLGCTFWAVKHTSRQDQDTKGYIHTSGTLGIPLPLKSL